MRPLKFRGLLMHRSERHARSGRRSLHLFATDEGGAVAQFMYEPCEGMPARPVFRVAPIQDATDLHEFLDVSGTHGFPPVRSEDGGEGVTDAYALSQPCPFPGIARDEHCRTHLAEGTQR
jgi:hypothetical protein